MNNMQVGLTIPLARFEGILSWGDPEIGRLVEAAIEVAGRVGLRIEGDGTADYLTEAGQKGLRVDSEEPRVLFDQAQLDETIEVMRKTRPAGPPLRPPTVMPNRDERFLVGNGANMLFDWDRWQARPPTAADLVALCHWAQGYDAVAELFPPFMLKDVDQRLGPIYSYALMCRHCRKKMYHEQPTEPIHVKYLDEMARIVEQHRGFYQPMQSWEYINPPFRLATRAIRTMLARIDTGACRKIGVGPMTVGGMSAPITIAGSAVVSLAEILCGLTFFRVLRPGCGLETTACTGSLDLRTAGVSYFGMRTHLQNLAIWELLVRGLGVDCSPLTWYRDANEPGMQALYEFGTAQAFFSATTGRCHPEIGGLANGNIFSPEQAVLDIAAVREFNELLHGFEVSDETLGLEEIFRAGFDLNYHIASEHTVRHMEAGVPFSDLLYRGLPAGAGHEKGHTQTLALLEKAHQAVTEARREGEAVEPDEDLAGRLYQCVEQAAAELGIEPPALC